MMIRINKDMARVIARTSFWDSMIGLEKNDPTLLKRLLIMKRTIRRKLGEPMIGDYTGSL